MELELINLELMFATTTKKPTPSTHFKQASTENRLAPYEVMDDFKLSTTLDPRFILNGCQNDESRGVRHLLTSQVVRLSPTTPAEYMEMNWNYSIWNWN